MTRRHFEILADFFNREIRTEIRHGRVDVAVHNLEVAESLTVILKKENAGFKHQRFMDRVLKDTHKNYNHYTQQFLEAIGEG